MTTAPRSAVPFSPTPDLTATAPSEPRTARRARRASPVGAKLPALATIGVAFVIRPLGANDSGHLRGEWGGAILIAAEHETRAKRAFAAAMPQIGSPTGSILADVAFLWLTLSLSSAEITEWAW